MIRPKNDLILFDFKTDFFYLIYNACLIHCVSYIISYKLQNKKY